MPEADAKHNYAFDLTKVWPHKEYPVIDIGVLELNQPTKLFCRSGTSRDLHRLISCPNWLLRRSGVCQVVCSYQERNGYRSWGNHQIGLMHRNVHTILLTEMGQCKRG